jgi:hypothetical protein
MKEDAMKHGAFGWFELMTTDVAGAKKFYADLFGWEMVPYPMGETAYTVFKVNGDETAGMMAIPPEAQGMPATWSIYITVDDVDATAKKVTELGGRILRPPMDIAEVGRFCVLQDPQGAAICAMTYAEKASS